MKKKIIIVLIIAGIFILGLGAEPVYASAGTFVMKNAAMGMSDVFDRQNEWIEQKIEDLKTTGETQLEQEQKEWWRKIADPHTISVKEPIVKWNGEEGILRYNWYEYRIWVDEGIFLMVTDCYFPKEKLQQKFFFLVEGPDFIAKEVFRQDSQTWDKELKWPETLEERMPCPQLVDGGFVYEMNGVLYFLDEDFKEASPLCDLRQLLGDFYMFSPRTIDTCDVTEDASKMLVCLDEGLYEYDLESGERKLLEPAYFAHHEIVLAEGDCACGQRDFRFDGPVKAEYGPDGQSYAFLTGTEEADWGDITGAFLRAADGETLYQKETEYIDDFEWVESEDTVYLEVSYWEEYDKKIDRVNVNTGEVTTFEDK